MNFTRLLATMGLLGASFSSLCAACSGNTEGPPAPHHDQTEGGSGPQGGEQPKGPDTSSDGGSPDATPDGPFDYCTAQAKRYATCFPKETFDHAACTKTEACLRSIYQPDLDVNGFLRCTSTSCSGGGNSCLKFISAHQDDRAFTDFLTACVKRREACGELGPKQFEDACSPFVVMGLRDELLSDRAACLAMDCGEIRDCMDEQLTKHCDL